jgi:hypothetical protein
MGRLNIETERGAAGEGGVAVIYHIAASAAGAAAVCSR